MAWLEIVAGKSKCKRPLTCQSQQLSPTNEPAKEAQQKPCRQAEFVPVVLASSSGDMLTSSFCSCTSIRMVFALGGALAANAKQGKHCKAVGLERLLVPQRCRLGRSSALLFPIQALAVLDLQKTANLALCL